MKTGAHLSACRTYRYALWRTWDEGEGRVMFVGLNPSTADETQNDNTIIRCINFAKSWGFGGIYMLNLFAFRSKIPKLLSTSGDPIGPENDQCLEMYAGRASRLICAWGARVNTVKFIRERAQQVHALLERSIGPNTHREAISLECLQLTPSGAPQHPLFVPGDVKPILYKGSAA